MRASISLLILTAMLWAQAARPAPGDLLEPAGSIPLANVSGRIDHFGVDIAGSRLFVAALGNNTLEVIDLKANRRVKSIPGFGEPQGVQVVPPFNRVYAANGSANRVDVLDATSLERIRSIEGLEDADNIRYDAAAQKIYVGYGKGALKVLDASTGDASGDIALAGHPESFQLEQAGARIFVNVPTARQIAVVDRAKRAVVATWEVPAAANFPMALDESGRRLFIGARNPAVLLVYDIDSGKVVARQTIGGDTDDIFFDTARKRIYVICGEGRIDVVQQGDADRYALRRSLRTAPRARTGLWVPETGRLYVAAPASGGSPAHVSSYQPR
ncbi:MAG TPA: YncE family protein [Burkholderiales bacterium]|nr:YncE family protein [Burkholderiales bacterium]